MLSRGVHVIEPTLQVVRLIGADPSDKQLTRQVAKFVRCNGAAGVIQAANAVARRRQTGAIPVRDAWAYCIRVFNGNAARSIVLHELLYLLENSLRSRVNEGMTAAGGRDWYRDVHAYLPREIAPVFLTDDQFQAVQTRGVGLAPPYAITEFRQGITFTEQIPFWGLSAIIGHNYAAGPLHDLFVAPAGEQRLDPEFVKSALDKVRSARNVVAHHRPVSPALYEQTRLRIVRFLEHLEFDVTRSSERIRVAVDGLAGVIR